VLDEDDKFVMFIMQRFASCYFCLLGEKLSAAHCAQPVFLSQGRIFNFLIAKDSSVSFIFFSGLFYDAANSWTI
jgi:hypothetical protein